MIHSVDFNKQKLEQISFRIIYSFLQNLESKIDPFKTLELVTHNNELRKFVLTKLKRL